MKRMKEEVEFCFEQADMWVDFLRVTGAVFEEATEEDMRGYVGHLESEIENGPDVRAM